MQPPCSPPNATYDELHYLRDCAINKRYNRHRAHHRPEVSRHGATVDCVVLLRESAPCRPASVSSGKAMSLLVLHCGKTGRVILPAMPNRVALAQRLPLCVTQTTVAAPFFPTDNRRSAMTHGQLYPAPSIPQRTQSPRTSRELFAIGIVAAQQRPREG